MAETSTPIPLVARQPRPPLKTAEAAGAGFPSPAQDWEETGIDLVELLALDRAASFVFRVSGNSMVDAGIFDGDTLIVDRDVDPKDGSIVIAIADGGFIVRQIKSINRVPHLIGRNPHEPYPPRRCDETVEIWGVVRASVRNFTR